MPPWSLEVFSDAAGGTTRETGHGVGAVAHGWWVVLPWGKTINASPLTEQGTCLDRMLSTLELLGPLLALSAAGHLCKGLPVKFLWTMLAQILSGRKATVPTVSFLQPLWQLWPLLQLG